MLLLLLGTFCSGLLVARIVFKPRAPEKMTEAANQDALDLEATKQKQTTIPQNVSSDFWETCHLDESDPWDPDIEPYWNTSINQLTGCIDYQRDTEIVDGVVKILESGRRKNYRNCENRCIGLVRDTLGFAKPWATIGQKLDCEVVEVRCYNERAREIYGFLHTHIIPVKSQQPPPSKKRYNVHVLVFDSVSHNLAMRSFPRTRSYFEKSMQGVVFPSLNRVGMNSRPNGVALFYGRLLERIDRRIFNESSLESDWDDGLNCANAIDDEPFIPRLYREDGFKTLFAEDWGWGLMNMPNCRGFQNPPVDHYMKPFNMATEQIATSLSTATVGGRSCTHHHLRILEYFQQFVDAYPNEADVKMSLMWLTNLAHDSMNHLRHTDLTFTELLRKNRKEFDNSFIFMMGDHGLRVATSFLKSKTGTLEARNPFLWVSLPKDLRNTPMSRNLAENAQKLQSHFDIHATFVDILKYQPSVGFRGVDYKEMTGERGSSLLRAQKDEPRNCRTMPIPFEYCICQLPTTTVSDLTSTLANRLGQAVTDEINRRLSDHGYSRICAAMEFGKLYSVEKFDQPAATGVVYRVGVRMTNADAAEFTAIARETPEGQIVVAGMIDRVSTYGKTATCMKRGEFQPICFCLS